GVTTDEERGTESTGADLAFLGRYLESYSGTLTRDSLGNERYAFRSVVDTTYAESAASALQSATDEYRAYGDVSPTVAGESAGRWVVESFASPAQMKRFISVVKSGAYEAYAAGKETTLDVGPIKALEAGLKGAQGLEEEQKLIAVYISQAGDSAIDQILALGGGDAERIVELEGDEFLQSAQAYRETEGRIAALEERVKGGDQGAVAGLQSESRAQNKRLGALQNTRNYPELPPVIRTQEIKRSTDWLTRIEAARTALSLASPDKATKTKSSGPVEDPTVEARRKELAMKRRQVEWVKTSSKAAYDALLLRYGSHTGGASYITTPARKALGDGGIYIYGIGNIGAKEEYAAYERFDAYRASGEKAQELAWRLYSEMDDVTEHTEKMGRYQSCMETFTEAQGSFLQADDILVSIRSRIRTSPACSVRTPDPRPTSPPRPEASRLLDKR
ncbi:MAG: hypothetical protein AAFV53_37840, partial [Myxococcota bacterium]